MRTLICVIVLVLVLFGCESPLDRTYNEKTLEEDAKAIRAEIDTTETVLLLGTIFRYKFEEKALEGKTYRDLIEEGRKFKAEQDKIEAEEKALAARAREAEEAKTKRLNESLTVTVFDKSFIKLDYEEYITYKFAFKNKTDKDILALTGVMIFNDLFDKKIKELSLTYDDGVAANSTIQWDATTEYNQFIDSDKALKNKDLDKIKLVWVPEKIIFKDGTTLE